MPLPVFGSGAEVVLLTKKVVQALRLFLKNCRNAVTQIDSVKQKLKRVQSVIKHFNECVIEGLLRPDLWKEITEVSNECEQRFESISLALTGYKVDMGSAARFKWASSWKSKMEEQMLELDSYVSHFKDLHSIADRARDWEKVARQEEMPPTMKPANKIETKVIGPTSSTSLPQVTAISTIPYPCSAPKRGSNARQQTSFQPSSPQVVAAANSETRTPAGLPTYNVFNPSSAVSPRVGPRKPTTGAVPRKFPAPSRTQQKQNPTVPTYNPLPVSSRPNPLTTQVPYQHYKPIPTWSEYVDAKYGVGTNGIDLEKYPSVDKPLSTGSLPPRAPPRPSAYNGPAAMNASRATQLGQQTSHPLQTASGPAPKRPTGPGYPPIPPNISQQTAIVPPATGPAPSRYPHIPPTVHKKTAIVPPATGPAPSRYPHIPPTIYP
ncbi:hypothetical protein CFIO01_04418 [Colletotrichum fioriniae PJ7]|uniref:Uncharacterized protein n=1 Tax=Colletotrichum fioriniae PJ7 TaxID=1445577 RepID=A0A010R9Q0_9PEZI|nr:hypothetical protein CFIO01_04418 [Colletotrichum fioriniae PJ7]